MGAQVTHTPGPTAADFAAVRKLSEGEDAMESGKRLKWTVEFEVDYSWIADGFDLTEDRALEMLANDLRGAYGHEIGATIKKAPPRWKVLALQGYEREAAIARAAIASATGARP